MVPKTKMLHGRQGARHARGLVVVIDVLRAFSTACYVAAGGAGRIVSVADADEAQRLKRLDSRAVLLGERDGCQIPGFDLGNSPSQAVRVDWGGRTAVLTTSNGTMGLAAVAHSAEVLTGSFVNAGAIVKYIRWQAPALVSLVCMGSRGKPAIEDTLCGLYLAAALKGRSLPFEVLKGIILRGGSVHRFLASQSPDMPAEDLERCLILDLFEFVFTVEKVPGWGTVLKRVDVA